MDTTQSTFRSITIDNMFALVYRISVDIARLKDAASQASLAGHEQVENERFLRRCDSTCEGSVDLAGWGAESGTFRIQEDKTSGLEGINLTSHDLRAYFQERGIHPHRAYPEYFSTEPPMAAVTYEWSLGFRGMQRFLNRANLSHFNRHNLDSFSTGNGDLRFSFSDFSFSEFSADDFSIIKHLLLGAGQFLRMAFCLQFCCEMPWDMPSDTAELRVWVDIFFNDQNSVDIVRELDAAEAIYRESKYHLVLATAGVVRRAWCLLEMLVRMQARKGSVMIGIYDDEQLDSVEGSIKLLDYEETKSRDLFSTMEAFSDDDKDKIKARILAVCTPDEFNSRIRSVALGFKNSMISLLVNRATDIIMAPYFLIVALFFITLFLIVLVVWIVLMAVKAVVICCLCLGRAVCPPQPAGPSYKRLL